MAKKIIQLGNTRNTEGHALAAQRPPALPANSLYFMQPRQLPPRAVPALPPRRRLEISIDPDPQAQVIHTVKITHVG